MRHETWPPGFWQRMPSLLMAALAAVGYRRWLSRPWQWPLRDYMIIVAACSAGLLVSRSPAPLSIFFTVLAGAVLACFILARHGFRFADVTVLLAIILITAAVILPAMERARNRTLGRTWFTFAVPTWYSTLLSSSR